MIIMECSFIDKILVFRSFCRIEARDFQCEDIDYPRPEDIFILVFYPCLCSVEERKEFSGGTFSLFLFLLLTFFIGIWVSLLFFLVALSLDDRNLVDFGLNSEISGLFFIPENLDRDFLFSEFIRTEAVILSVVNVESMANKRP